MPKDCANLSDIEHVPIERLMAEHGSPLFVFSERTLRETIRRFQAAFQTRYALTAFAWSYKTNYLGAVCAILHQEGAWAEVVSTMEFELARARGVPLDRIVFNGPHKGPSAMLETLDQGGIVNIDHDAEIATLDKAAKERGRTLEIGLRVNLDASIAPPWSRFGYNLESGQAWQAASRLAQTGRLAIAGLHCHIGTAIRDAGAYGRSVAKLVKFGYELTDRWGWPMRYLDVGGGFASPRCVSRAGSPVPDGSPSPSPSADDYARAICDALAEQLRPAHRPRLILEAGRALIDESGYLIASVIATKTLPDGTHAAIVDAGVNVLGMASQFRLPVRAGPISRRAGDTPAQPREPGDTAPLTTTLFGPLCMPTDIVADALRLPPLHCGQPVIFESVGAYNLTQSWQFIEYRPAVVLIRRDGRVEQILAREELSDIQRREQIPDDLRSVRDLHRC